MKERFHRQFRHEKARVTELVQFLGFIMDPKNFKSPPTEVHTVQLIVIECYNFFELFHRWFSKTHFLFCFSWISNLNVKF